MTDDDARHKKKAAKRQEAHAKKLAGKTIAAKGLLMVHTGNGKGKSTAAFGLVLRAIGNGMRVGVVQFVKGKWDTGERTVLERFPDQIEIKALGEGFSWDTQDRERDIRAADAAWKASIEMMADKSFSMVVLDEINIALRYGHLDAEQVAATLAARRDDLHGICTGRNAPAELIEPADLVTDMTMVKHHFKAGVRAQKGIEY